MNRSVRSFDIFDTLLARSVKDPVDIFDIIESRGIHDFKNLRIKSQNMSNHTWDDIYRNYKILSGLDDADISRIQKIELETEAEHSFLITENYNKVRDGDILVSDMYLPEPSLRWLLNYIGFQKEVDIFVSSAGKASGKIWPTLKERFNIEWHIGDNIHSDVESPRQHGINSIHYAASTFSFFENFLMERGAFSAATTIRQFRLANPFPEETLHNTLYNLQASVNLPFMLLMSARLRHIMEQESLSRILFSMRDSCILHPIFDILYPDIDSHAFLTSRIAYSEQRPCYVDYIKKLYIPGSTLIFDLHGAFKSGRDLFRGAFNTLPRVHIFSGAQSRAPDYEGLTYDVTNGTNAIELFNVDRVGALVTIDENGQPIRTPSTSTQVEIGSIYGTILGFFKEKLRLNARIIKQELGMAIDQIPWHEIHQFIVNYTKNSAFLSRFEPAEHSSLTHLMNAEQSDKGNMYACAHCYTYIYERLVHDLSSLPSISLLEIGLNRDGNNSIPSLRGWKKYLGEKITLYGVDINPDFRCYHNPGEGLHILTADQSKSSELIRCGLANPDGFDLIIDDGSHLSSHQQTTISTLWQFVKPGGYYVIEDLHYQPYVESIMKTKDMLRFWKNSTPASSPFVSRADAARIISEMASIEFFDSKSTKWGNAVVDALAVIRKRR